MIPQYVRVRTGNHTKPGDHKVLSRFVMENETSLCDELTDIMKEHNVSKAIAKKVMALRGTAVWTTEQETNLITQELLSANAKQIWTDFVKRITP